MIRYGEKRAVLDAVRLAMMNALNEHERVIKECSALYQGFPGVSFWKGTDQAAAAFFAIVESEPLAAGNWLSEELDRVPDADLHGELGVYNATINQLELLKAIRTFYETLTEYN